MTSAANDELTPRLDWALEVATRGGDSTLRHFRSPQLAVEQKADSSPVTVADQGAERLMRQLILDRFPADGIVGEEFGTTEGSSGYTWVLDPIDGTKSFIYGIPLYTTLVAVMSTPTGDPDSGRPEIGVIRAPALQEHVFARRGGPALHVRDGEQPVVAQVGSISSLDQALLLTSEVATFETHRAPPALDVYLELQRQAKVVRTWGDAYGYLMVATGRADVMIDAAMSLWDAAAIQPIIEGAGGKFTDWQGVATVHSGEAVATNPKLIEKILAATRGR